MSAVISSPRPALVSLACLAQLVRPHRRTLLFAGLAGLVFLVQFARSMCRDFDLDEHQFVAPPALLVQQGVRPYADYPYFHMPNLVYLYAGLVGWAPYRLLAARTLSALCGTATVLLLFAAGWRLLAGFRDRLRWLIPGGIALTFASSRLFTYTSGWAWNHDTAVLATLLACLLHIRGLHRARVGSFAAAGFLAGAAAGIRLSFALTFLVFVPSLLLSPSALTLRRRLTALGLAVLAACVALVPAFVHMAETPDAFFFGNLGYARLNTIFYRNVAEPSPIALPARLGHGVFTFVSDPSNAALLALFVLAVLALVRKGRTWESRHRSPLLLLLGLLATLAVGALGPAPAQYQYHYMLLPFLALATLYAVAAQGRERAARRRWGRLVLAGALLAAATGLPRWYWPVIYLPTPERWTTVQVHRAGEWVRAHVPAGARVLTIDPLVPLEGGVTVYPEYAVGRFVMHVGRYMTPAERQRFQMAWGEELDRRLAERPPDAILCSHRLLPLAVPLEQYASAHGFRPVETADGAYRLWVRPGG
jgi:4-amino-4-deoxy-L-arabinose transferase-like glycosyltransferase